MSQAETSAGGAESPGARAADVAATCCATFVDTWIRLGVTHACVAPGSRSTPMALALADRRELAVSIHHDERFWPEPEVFDPTRFLPENARTHHRSAYLPFGGGRRVCIGSSFALMEGTLIAAMMSQRFVYDLVPGHRVEPEATLTLRPRRGLRMVARRRTGVPGTVGA